MAQRFYWHLVVCTNFGALVRYSIPAVSAAEACNHFNTVYGNGTITRIEKGYACGLD